MVPGVGVLTSATAPLTGASTPPLHPLVGGVPRRDVPYAAKALLAKGRGEGGGVVRVGPRVGGVAEGATPGRARMLMGDDGGGVRPPAAPSSLGECLAPPALLCGRSARVADG